MVKETLYKFGSLDILVNNAANVALKDGSIEELTLEMWDDIFQSDINGKQIAALLALIMVRP